MPEIQSQVMKPSYAQVLQHFPAHTSRHDLYSEIGWDDLSNNPAYMNTCAVRMSYGLLRAGVPLPGTRIKARAALWPGNISSQGRQSYRRF